MQHCNCDILIVGSGSAGLRAAIAAREKNMDVLVVSKRSPGKATATVVSGGVFAATREGDSTQGHRARTLQAGRGINQPELVNILVEEGPARLKEMRHWGIDAEFRQGYLFSKGRPPIWGESIIQCLLQRNRAVGTRFMGGTVVAALKMRKDSGGALAFCPKSGNWITINAGAVILATGGCAALYKRHDNPQGMLGDGYALALAAGAILQDMEFVQFYPLGVAEPGLAPFLIPPRIADKGLMFNRRQEEIHEKYNILERPAAEKARDKLSQALFNEIYRDGQEVFLDMRIIPDQEWMKDPFSASARQILAKRYGALERALRIAPMAHHVMGGVQIDPWCSVSVPGLYAAGEVTGGLHGANRMGGNALTETLVFGKRAGEAAAAWIKTTHGRGKKRRLFEFAPGTTDSRAGAAVPRLIHLKKQLKELMWEQGGIVRNGHGLAKALVEAQAILDQAHGNAYCPQGEETHHVLELRTAAYVATLILQAALRRAESRGAHFREDYSAQDDENWRGHLLLSLTAEGAVSWNFQAV
jgi:succinate dehydrogenase/fumarate reductase flavoprotein subunit